MRSQLLGETDGRGSADMPIHLDAIALHNPTLEGGKNVCRYDEHWGNLAAPVRERPTRGGVDAGRISSAELLGRSSLTMRRCRR